MSFYSRSSKKNHYKHGHHGSDHYQKKGLLGKLFNSMFSGSGSGGHYKNYGHPANNDAPMQNQSPSSQGSTNCIKCNNQIQAGSKFCLNCGEPVKAASFCTNCGEKMPPNAKFCSGCGNKLNG